MYVCMYDVTCVWCMRSNPVEAMKKMMSGELYEDIDRRAAVEDSTQAVDAATSVPRRKKRV